MLWFMTCLAAWAWLHSVTIPDAWAAQPPVAPPPPVRRPIISETYPQDTDGDRIDDRLMEDVITAWTRPGDIGIAADRDLIDVQLVFNAPVTQQQVDDFVSLGGQVTYMYQAISYGWHGRISPRLVELLPFMMGPSLVQIVRQPISMPCMDVATRTGRVRPVWETGFVGSGISGFKGNDQITVAIVDSGVDGSHPDLEGRKVYWLDQSNESGENDVPIDYDGHGSHVAGILTGTGKQSGMNTGTLQYTVMADLKGASAWYPYPMALPSGRVDLQAKAAWNGGSSATLRFLHSVSGQYHWYWLEETSVESGRPWSLGHDCDSSHVYCFGLFNNSNGTVHEYAIASSVTNYPAVGDGYCKLRGVADSCNWAAVRVENRHGNTPSGGGIGPAISSLFDDRVPHKIRVVNVSRGIVDAASKLPSENTNVRNEVNTSVRDGGMVIVVSAGNGADDGDPSGGEDQPERKMADPARAKMAITVGAANDRNALTAYSTYGFANPSSYAGEDYKPDVIAPGGSDYYRHLLSVDSGSADSSVLADQQNGDYTLKKGTSMAAPFVAGAAALVIEAMQRRGFTWDPYSDRDPRFVKMILCATATETYKQREDGNHSPTLQRAGAGPKGFPAGKDPYEGYGLINPDAAIEAVYLDYSWGSTVEADLGGTINDGLYDRRAWARRITMESGADYKVTLTNPSTGDFDLYVYKSEPSATGTPVFLGTPSTSTSLGYMHTETVNLNWADRATSSSNALAALSETSTLDTYSAETADMGAQATSDPPFSSNHAIIVVKRVRGHGSFSLVGTRVVPTVRISGYVRLSGGTGVQGVTITRSDGPSTTTDTWGYYAHDVPVGWSGTLTASKTGYTISPSNLSFPPVYSNQSANFTATPITRTISGYVRVGTTGLSGVTISRSDGGTGATTSSSGYYSISVLYGWSGTLTPSRTDYAFDPASKYFSNVTANQSFHFAAEQVPTNVVIYGYVRSGWSAMADVTISGTAGYVAGTDSSGYYELEVPRGWSGMVMASKDCTEFTPEGKAFYSITASERLDFEGISRTPVISGYVRTSGGIGISGVTVRAGTNYATTSASGYYYIFLSCHWSGTVSFSKSGYWFWPSSRYYSDLTESATLNSTGY